MEAPKLGPAVGAPAMGLVHVLDAVAALIKLHLKRKTGAGSLVAPLPVQPFEDEHPVRSRAGGEVGGARGAGIARQIIPERGQQGLFAGGGRAGEAIAHVVSSVRVEGEEAIGAGFHAGVSHAVEPEAEAQRQQRGARSSIVDAQGRDAGGRRRQGRERAGRGRKHIGAHLRLSRAGQGRSRQQQQPAAANESNFSHKKWKRGVKEKHLFSEAIYFPRSSSIRPLRRPARGWWRPARRRRVLLLPLTRVPAQAQIGAETVKPPAPVCAWAGLTTAPKIISHA